jgi:hypothetical protein
MSRAYRRALVVAAAGLLAVGTSAASLATATSATAGSTSHASKPAAVRYVVARQVCAPPTRPGLTSCQAVAEVPASATTPNAVAVTPAAAAPRTATTSPGALSHGPAGGYTPADLASAYHFSPTSGGRGQTIALVDADNDPNIRTDLNAFDAQYGIPAETTSSFRVVNGNGKSSPLPANDATQAFEESIDVEAARAVCRDCRLLLVEGKNAQLSTLARAAHTAIRLGATEVSNSYGGLEPPKRDVSHGTLARLQKLYTHKGVVVTASTGDEGWHGWDVANEGVHSPGTPLLPSAISSVVAVGGTSLVLDSTGSRSSETVWNNNGPHDSRASSDPTRASGGGCSHLYSANRWERDIKGWSHTGCGKHRLATDVAAIADPAHGFDIRDTFDSPSGQSWTMSGGTSLASPIVAAMWALKGGAHHEPHPALTLYGNLRHHPRSAVYDVHSGGNGYCGGDGVTTCLRAGGLNPHNTKFGVLDCGPGKKGHPSHPSECKAESGFDGPSGVGSPASLRLFTTLRLHAKAHHSKLKAHHTATFRASHVRDPFPGGHVVSLTWKWGHGGGKSHGTVAHHVFGHKGKTVVRLVLTDSYGISTTRKLHVKVK